MTDVEHISLITLQWLKLFIYFIYLSVSLKIINFYFNVHPEGDIFSSNATRSCLTQMRSELDCYHLT